ncbi:MAG: polysaccharide biosynthesis tyrosine autokinase [Campylobacterota bacterium]|nr:polysaccharide biosynthesis tyrosine autokinase [Campylobacterota bacterium]
MNNIEIKERETDEDEIDLKAIFRTLSDYKAAIITFAVIFTLFSAVYAYFKPSIYSSFSTVEVGLEPRGGSQSDILAAAVGGDAAGPDTEMDIIRSRFLASHALRKVDFTHRYYGIKMMKERELYKDSPFDVNLTEGENISFGVYPVDKIFYRLKAKGVDKETREEWSYEKVHRFGAPVKDKYFAFVLHKKAGRELTADSYRFVVLDLESATDTAMGGVSVSPLSKFSTLLKITYEDPVPLRAQEFANALAESYIEQSVYRKTREASRTLEFVDNQLLEINENLKDSAVQLENFKIKTSTISLDTKAQGVVTRMGDYETKLAEIRIEEELLNSLYNQVKAGKSLETISVIGLEGKNEQSGPLTGLVKELQQNVLKIKLLRSDFTEQYPEVRKLRRQIIQLKKIIISTIKNMKSNISERRALIVKSIESQQKLLEALPQNEREFGKLQRKFVINEKIYSYLLEQRSATAIAKASTVSKNRVVDNALLPKGPIKPKKKLMVIIGLILGLILGIAYAFLREFLDDTVKNEEDVSRGTSAGLLGVVPKMGKVVRGSLQVFEAPKSEVAESFRNIRTNLQFMAPEADSQVIAVTSTIAGEGKTTISANLAGVISMTGKRVIVLNLDMRKPMLHKEFGLRNNEGLSTVLSNHALLSDVIQHSAYEDLDIISSGPVPPNPSELIQSKRMDDVIEKLKSVYDIIIMDTPPIGVVTDAHTLIHLADATVYVIRSEYAKKGFLRNVEKLHRTEGIQGLGVVLNDVNMKKYAYGYGYGYGYGGEYYEEKG